MRRCARAGLVLEIDAGASVAVGVADSSPGPASCPGHRPTTPTGSGDQSSPKNRPAQRTPNSIAAAARMAVSVSPHVGFGSNKQLRSSSSMSAYASIADTAHSALAVARCHSRQLALQQEGNLFEPSRLPAPGVKGLQLVVRSGIPLLTGVDGFELPTPGFGDSQAPCSPIAAGVVLSDP